MLGKLLKHEFRATGRIMLPVLGVLVILAVLANFSMRFIDTVNLTLVNVLFVIFIAAFFLGIFAAWIVAVVVMIDRFYRNLLKDEGYLMFTLPANVHELLWSKLIVSFVWFIATALVIFAVIAGTVMDVSRMDVVEIFRGLPSWSEVMALLARHGVTGGDLALFALEGLLALILESLTLCLHFYAAMALGQMFSKDKVLLSIVFFVVISIAFQLLSFGVLGASVDLLEDTVMINSLGEGVHYFQTLSVGGLLYALFQAAILYLVTTLSLQKKLNLA